MTSLAKQISISINRSKKDVYIFASNPENLPRWASGLSQSKIIKTDHYWIANSPMGRVKVTFAPKNPFGVMDHEVILPSGEVNYNPFRVVKNNDGSEVTFTLFRLPRMSDADFDRDSKTVKKDL